MILKNHIAYRFLTDETLLWEMLEATYPTEWKELMNKKSPNEKEFLPKLAGFYEVVRPTNNKTFYITESVLANLNLLKIEKKNNHYNWSVFQDIGNRKYTFILPDNCVLRLYQGANIINLVYMKFSKNQNHGPSIEGEQTWEMLYFDRLTGELCPHFDHPNALKIEEFLYKFMCFFFLTDNDELEVSAGKSHGTRKSGKIINDFKFPITMVNSRWNTTIIRTEGFLVSGHFRLQPFGPNLKKYRIIFIEPFEKHGYKRLAGKNYQL